MDKKMVEDLSNALPVLDEILNEWDEHWALTMHSNSMCREPFEEMFITVFWEKLNGQPGLCTFTVWSRRP